VFGPSAKFPTRIIGLRSALLVLALVLFAVVLVSPAFAATFNPNLVISDDNMRADDSMSVASIQAFLVEKKSLLATESFPRHDRGKTASAAVIIYEAARAFRISPRVLLVMLQKEQGLITRTSVTPTTYDRAIGAGCPNKTTNKYPGFGNQMWYGAKLLDGYGEGKNGSTIALFHSGIRTWDIYQHPHVAIYPRSLATYKLYVYNPSIGASQPYPNQDTPNADDLGGNASFWVIYWRFFEDPLARPAVRSVYSFQSRSNASFIYTMSPAEKYRLSRSTKSYRYRGSIASVNTSGGVNPLPVYKFQNRKTGVYTYTTSLKTKQRLQAQRKRYLFKGVAFYASGNNAGRPVYRFVSKKNAADVFVTSAAQKRSYQSKANKKKYRYAGVAFYVMP